MVHHCWRNGTIARQRMHIGPACGFENFVVQLCNGKGPSYLLACDKDHGSELWRTEPGARSVFLKRRTSSAWLRTIRWRWAAWPLQRLPMVISMCALRTPDPYWIDRRRSISQNHHTCRMNATIGLIGSMNDPPPASSIGCPLFFGRLSVIFG